MGPNVTKIRILNYIVGGAGCDHEFCTHCALYLCSTNNTSNVAQSPIGSIACPLCRSGIISFVKLPGTKPTVKPVVRTSLSLSFCTCSSEIPESSSMTTPLCKPEVGCTQISPLGSSFRSISCHSFPSMKIQSSLCMGAPNTSTLVPCPDDRDFQNQLVRCSKSGLRRAASDGRRSWFSAINQCVTTGSGC